MASALLCLISVAPVTLRSAQAPEPSVWDGVFTEVQAERGGADYARHCANCHGANLEGGGLGRPLTGDQFWNDWRENTVDVLLGRISASMPNGNAGSLPAATYADIVAHILERNELPAGTDELTWDSSVGVQIIAEDGPGELPASTLAHIVGCLERGGEGGWRVVRSTAPVRPDSDDPGSHSSVPLGEEEFALMFVLIPLDNIVGHRVVARGLLIGEGGVDGLNVSRVDSVAEVCE